jgi:hypothetical protein
LAANKAGVTVSIVGLSRSTGKARLFNGKEGTLREVDNINAYLIAYDNIYIRASTKPLQGLNPVVNGSKPADGGGLIVDSDTAKLLRSLVSSKLNVVRPFFGAHDALYGASRFCIWVSRLRN